MIKKLASNKIIAIFTAIVCCALWGISTPVVKMGYPYIDEAHVPALLLSEDGGVAPVNLIIALVLVCIGILLWGYEKTKKA